MIEYKIINAYSIWGQRKTKQAIEAAINENAKEGWRVVSVSFTSYHGAYATLERDKNLTDIV